MLDYPISVTIDTNVFYSARYDFGENGKLRALSNYVKNGKIKVVLSDIVVREARAHILKQVDSVCGIVKKSRKDVLNHSNECLVKHIGLGIVLETKPEKERMKQKALELFDQYLIDIKAERLKSDLVNVDSIIDDYFEFRPPFEKSEKKRKEFPDAFIANQIRERFNEETVAIVSKDKGFIAACGNKPNHMFFDTLSDLFDKINKEEATYKETINIIEELQYIISSKIVEYIIDNENIDVIGLSYDKDGIESGYDYSDVYLDKVSNTSFIIDSVEELEDIISTVLLTCKATISADCFYEDYDNAIWDSEDKTYAFLETINMREVHDATFDCRIELNRETKKVTILPFAVVLDADSRKEMYVIDENKDTDYEQEINDMDRETLGFIPLGNYETYIEENLPESDMSCKILSEFEKFNEIYRNFDDISTVYDLLDAEINIDKSMLLKPLSKALKGLGNFPDVADVEDIGAEEIDEIKTWVNSQYEHASDICEIRLPDCFNYGEKIAIKGVDGSEIIFSIDEIENIPTEGDSEYINMSLTIDGVEVAAGYVKLTVGYLDFNDDGGVADGVKDEIEYDYYDIMSKIEEYYVEQKEILQQELKIIEIIKNIFKELDIEI